MVQPIIRGVSSNFYILEFDGQSFIGHHEGPAHTLEADGVKIIRRMSVPEVIAILRDAHKEGKIDE